MKTDIDITVTEKLLLRDLVNGQSNKVIARNHGKSDQTVRNQLSILFKKISASNRSQAANWYRNNKAADSVF
jgi:DNA-binding NarL/FixJ family response regulator